MVFFFEVNGSAGSTIEHLLPVALHEFQVLSEQSVSHDFDQKFVICVRAICPFDGPVALDTAQQRFLLRLNFTLQMYENAIIAELVRTIQVNPVQVLYSLGLVAFALTLKHQVLLNTQSQFLF